MRAAAVFPRRFGGDYTQEEYARPDAVAAKGKLLEEAQSGLYLTLLKPLEGWVVARKTMVVYLWLVVHIDV